MRILIFILALMSAFFVSASEPDMSDLVAPKLTPNGAGTCTRGEPEVSLEECKKVADGTEAKFKDNPHFILNTETITSVNSNGYTVVTWEFTCSNCGYNGTPKTFTTWASYVYNRVSETCPPDDFPEHTIPVTVDTDSTKCAKPFVPKDCPAGYHSKKVSQQLGSTECLPKECPAAGSGENLSSTPMTGGVPFNGGGMYCNDGCAYTVNASQISSSKYAVGTSQGAACGDKPYDNKKLADEGDTGNCTTATNGDVTLLSCPDANPTTPEPDPHNNDDSKVNEDDTPEKPKETCAEGDTSCNLKNVETEIENSINRQIDNDNELHNKKIDADTKNAKAFLNAMESIDTAILLQTSQDERLHAVTVGKFNELIDAVNGIETGGGGGGGNGTGNGNIGGQDCEGTIEECAGIGSGDGVELPHETKNLEQYAQKYQNWLPDAELPQEKCITLTTGYTACFSFHYIIYFLQALSGLIVLSSLIHSAAIIVRSV
ncbi:hypothetical protein [Pseudoalteromonas arabiensis]|uniref:hypothetical protein n=1 Tax=Pseudoalteromonas arabiensis TaxID=874454 RepID=UPI000784F7CF|nr:hypothetical protein [Pseudoalteromonas arabiensis]